MDDAITAFHEAGHAWAALFVGARVCSVTIDPDRDDGPNRFGDTVVLWHRRHFSAREMCEKAAWVSLAGPVAEMICSQQPFHPAIVPEWQQDWQSAVDSLQHVTNIRKRLAMLEQYTIELYQAFNDDLHWSAIGTIADSLLAHETLEEDMLQEIVEPWLPETHQR